MDTGSSYGFTCTLQSAQSDELENKMESPIPRSPESCLDYIHFAKFLAMRRIEIIPLKDLVCLDGMDMEQSIKGGNVKLDAIGSGGYNASRSHQMEFTRGCGESSPRPSSWTT
jgi:hypothetical protein